MPLIQNIVNDTPQIPVSSDKIGTVIKTTMDSLFDLMEKTHDRIATIYDKRITIDKEALYWKNINMNKILKKIQTNIDLEWQKIQTAKTQPEIDQCSSRITEALQHYEMNYIKLMPRQQKG